MILKFTHNLRIDANGNISISSEQIVEDEAEAEQAGDAFRKIMEAFFRGYGDKQPE